MMNTLIRCATMLFAALVLVQGTEIAAKGPRTILSATLLPVAGAPAAAKGKAKYDVSASRTNFSVEGQNLASLNGRTADISVNGSKVGSATIALGRLKLELSTERRQTVPNMPTGSFVEVFVNGQRILSGGLR